MYMIEAQRLSVLLRLAVGHSPSRVGQSHSRVGHSPSNVGQFLSTFEASALLLVLYNV
jgi:hypothetical protein